MQTNQKQQFDENDEPLRKPIKGILLPVREWTSTMLCGCGECRFKKPISGLCPRRDMRGAITLWSSRPREESSEQIPEKK